MTDGRFTTLAAYERDLDRRFCEAEAEEEELRRNPAGTPDGDALRQDIADRERIEGNHRVQAKVLRRLLR